MSAALCLAGPSLSAEKAVKIPKSVLIEPARATPGGRGVLVAVSQAELGSNINPSMATLALGGGVLGVMIDAKIGSDRAHRAESGITPIRTRLMDFDADQLALDTTRGALSSLPWFEGHDPAFARVGTVAVKNAKLDGASEGQVAFFDYVYDTTPDFSSIRVGVRISIADKAAGKPGKPDTRLSNRNLVYDQTVTSVVQLANPLSGPENAERWAAQDGQLAKQALTAGFAEVGKLISRALTISPDDITRMQAAEVKNIGVYRGRLVEEDASGTLLFNGGLVHVQTLTH